MKIDCNDMQHRTGVDPMVPGVPLYIPLDGVRQEILLQNLYKVIFPHLFSINSAQFIQKTVFGLFTGAAAPIVGSNRNENDLLYVFPVQFSKSCLHHIIRKTVKLFCNLLDIVIATDPQGGNSNGQVAL